MAFSISLAGKGGTGKTTVAGMLIKYLVNGLSMFGLINESACGPFINRLTNCAAIGPSILLI